MAETALTIPGDDRKNVPIPRIQMTVGIHEKLRLLADAACVAFGGGNGLFSRVPQTRHCAGTSLTSVPQRGQLNGLTTLLSRVSPFYHIPNRPSAA
jgi:hypothetical protein